MDTGNDQTDKSGAINVLNKEIQGRLLTQLDPLRRTTEKPIVRPDTKSARGLLVAGNFIG